jgi:hypothetical protein
MTHLNYAMAQEHIADLHSEAEAQRRAALARPTGVASHRRRTMIVRHYRLAIAALALVVAAVLATTAYARPIADAGPYGDASLPAVPGTTTSRQVSVVTASPHSGFDWGDAGIGAGAAFALSTMGVGGALLVAGNRRRRAAA